MYWLYIGNKAEVYGKCTGYVLGKLGYCPRHILEKRDVYRGYVGTVLVRFENLLRANW